ncbi:MAG: hypothetical protein J5949_04150, partial [Oscillospiraceae bacterium]|nr:hypothetical protein [Oscillospiraceae bacterium]
KPQIPVGCLGSLPESVVATAPQRCELSFNYFTVYLTGCSSFMKERRKTRSTIASMLLLVFLLTLFPVTAFADEGETPASSPAR